MTDPSLYYLPDGRHICQICCEVKTRAELEPVSPQYRDPPDRSNQVWDVCRSCAARERQQASTRW